MQAVLVLKVTMIVDDGEKKFSINMPYTCMATPQNPAKNTDLAEVKVVNESGENIVIGFLGKVPCNPPTTSIQDRGKQLLVWEPEVDVDKYFFVVSQEPTTDSGGNVTPTMGTIDIVIVG